jgi:hypothetical protein
MLLEGGATERVVLMRMPTDESAPPEPIWRGHEHSSELVGVSARSDGAVVVFATGAEVLRYDEAADPRFFP